MDSGSRPGQSTDTGKRIKELEREVKELTQTNGILRKAAAFFSQAELDCKPRR
jgi:transposase-like protein